MPRPAHRGSPASKLTAVPLLYGRGTAPRGQAMGYSLNFTLIWRHFDRLWGGLILSLELALLAISIGAVIGLTLAVAHVRGGRIVRALIGAYVEFIRNVPLILLVYLVF